jgi:hypothetical protein
MKGNYATFERRLAKLENTKLTPLWDRLKRAGRLISDDPGLESNLRFLRAHDEVSWCKMTQMWGVLPLVAR